MTRVKSVSSPRLILLFLLISVAGTVAAVPFWDTWVVSQTLYWAVSPDEVGSCITIAGAELGNISYETLVCNISCLLRGLVVQRESEPRGVSFLCLACVQRWLCHAQSETVDFSSSTMCRTSTERLQSGIAFPVHRVQQPRDHSVRIGLVRAISQVFVCGDGVTTA